MKRSALPRGRWLGRCTLRAVEDWSRSRCLSPSDRGGTPKRLSERGSQGRDTASVTCAAPVGTVGVPDVYSIIRPPTTLVVANTAVFSLLLPQVRLADVAEHAAILLGDLVEKLVETLVRIVAEGDGVDLDLLVGVELADFLDDLVVVGEVAVGQHVNELGLDLEGEADAGDGVGGAVGG